MFSKIFKSKKTEVKASKSIAKLSKIELVNVVGGKAGDPILGVDTELERSTSRCQPA